MLLRRSNTLTTTQPFAKWFPIFAFLLLLTLSKPFLGQTTNGTVLGDVVDPQGAVIPGASVTLTNAATSTAQAVVTDQNGEFRIFPVQPGIYRLHVSHRGFQAAMQPSILVDAASQVKIGIVLKIGQASQTVQVSGGVPLLQTQDASVGATIGDRDLARLPVNGRNYTKLILLSPGSSDAGNAQNQGTFSGDGLYAVNGQRQQDNNYTLDGVDNNFLYQNSPGMSPPMDAIQEFRVLNDTSAEFGRSAGANVNLVIKSGSRDLHGTLYEYIRNSALDANGFFTNHIGAQKLPFRQNQFGVTAGGPVILPRVYNGRERTFWFADYEGFREVQGKTQLSNTPTAAERTGDLSALSVKLFDPFTSDPVTGVRAQFAKNNIGSRIDPNALRVLNALMPLPNASGTTNNLINTKPLTNNRNLWNLRLDHSLTKSDNLMFRYSFQNVYYVSPYTNPNQASVAYFNVRNFVAGWTHTFNQNTILETKFGYNDPNIPIHDVNSRVTRAQLLQEGGIQMLQAEIPPYEPLPILTVTGEFTYTSGTGGGGQDTEDHIYQPIVNLTHVMRRHTVRMGADTMVRHFYQTTANPMNGTLTYSSTQTGQQGVSGTGDSLASFLLGIPSKYAISTGSTATEGRGPYQAYYAQDDWRVNPKLTVNSGLRYELTMPPYATNNQIGTLDILYNPATGAYYDQQYWAGDNVFTGQGPQRGGLGRALQKTQYLNFAPRFGVAYQVSPSTVVRAGFGIFYNSTFFQELMDKRKFYPYTPQLTNSVNASGAPTFFTTSPAPPIQGNIGGWAQATNKESPYSQQWNVYVQRQLGNTYSLELGYFGAQNVHQIGYTFINEALPGPGSVASRRPIPSVGDINGGLNIFASNYNSFRVNATKRYANGLQFLANYTWAKALGQASSLNEALTQNIYDRAADYGRLSFDVRHVFQAAYVYDLPFGNGRRFGGNWGHFADAAFGGWGMEGITRIESGPPMNILSGSDIANVGASDQRPNLVGNPNPSGGRGRVFLNQPWVNKAAYAFPASGSFGSAPQNSAQADGLSSWDISIQKGWRTTESQKLDFRAELFNFPNHVNFSSPPSGNRNLNSSSFGIVTSATASREIQFSLRYSY